MKYSYLLLGWSYQSPNCPIFISDEKELPTSNMAREPVMLNVYDMVGEFTMQCIVPRYLLTKFLSEGSAPQIFSDSIRLSRLYNVFAISYVRKLIL